MGATLKTNDPAKLAELLEQKKNQNVVPVARPTTPGDIVAARVIKPAEEVSSEWEQIGPHEAKLLLTRRTGQRPCSGRHVNYLARLMTEGRFDDMTGESIKIDYHGNLIDGQHRLEAVIRANKTYRFLVVRGLNPEAFKSVDQGKKRSGGDALAVLGVPHYIEAAHAIRTIFAMRDGLGAKQDSSRTMVDNGAISDFAAQHFGHVVWMANLVTGIHEIVSPGLLGAVIFLGGIGQQGRAEDFVHRIKTGLGQNADDPDYVLRQRLMKLRELARSDKRNPRRSLTAAEGVPWIVSGWNAYAMGRRLAKINPSKNVQEVRGAPRDWIETLFRRTFIIRPGGTT